jgi:coenzyme F420-reducing hydrogenase delta subunit
MKNQSARISLFYCSNSLSSEEVESLNSRLNDVNLNSMSLPCSGKVNLLYLLKAIETGSDGVLLVSCKIGECKYLQGNLRARKRIETVNDLLSETGFGSDRVKFVSLEDDNKTDTMLSAIRKLAETIGAEIQEIQK